VHTDLVWHKEDPLFVDQAFLDAHASSGYELNDLTDKGKMFLILFQCFAYMQICNILNARRPSYRDLNPLSGISFFTSLCGLALLGFQFSLCYVPSFFGFGSIDEYTNLVCMAVGAASVVWFMIAKISLRFFVEIEQAKN